MIETWFPTLMYHQNLSKQFDKNFNNKIYNHIKSIRENKERKLNWNCSTYSTLGIADLTKVELYRDLINVCSLHVSNFARSFGVDEKSKLTCIDLWGNIAKPGDYQEKHNHPMSHFSLIYYVKCPENCGKTYFYSPVANDMFPLPITNMNENTFTNVCIKPTESYIVIFRSHLMHMVEQNKSEQERCSIAMNFEFCK